MAIPLYICTAMKTKFIILFSVVALFISSCSSSEDTTESSKEESQAEVYVFDDVTENEDTTTAVTEQITEQPVVESYITQYFVQVGAFTTKERADQFYKENSSKISYPLNISYSEEVKLFVVQLPPFTTKAEAEKVRNELWQNVIFKDAFIVTK